jgi:hypothetical protein
MLVKPVERRRHSWHRSGGSCAAWCCGVVWRVQGATGQCGLSRCRPGPALRPDRAWLLGVLCPRACFAAGATHVRRSHADVCVCVPCLHIHTRRWQQRGWQRRRCQLVGVRRTRLGTRLPTGRAAGVFDTPRVRRRGVYGTRRVERVCVCAAASWVLPCTARNAAWRVVDTCAQPYTPCACQCVPKHRVRVNVCPTQASGAGIYAPSRFGQPSGATAWPYGGEWRSYRAARHLLLTLSCAQCTNECCGRERTGTAHVSGGTGTVEVQRAGAAQRRRV